MAPFKRLRGKSKYETTDKDLLPTTTERSGIPAAEFIAMKEGVRLRKTILLSISSETELGSAGR